jgi:hypothetical protein
MWTDAKKQLPEADKEVLTFGTYGYTVGSVSEDGKWKAKDTDYETSEPCLYDGDCVSHWANLPAPPNQKGDSK